MSNGHFPVLWVGAVAVVALPVEIDATNADDVREDLLALVNQGTDSLIVDMSATTFCDSAGVSALVRVFRRAEADDTPIKLVIAAEAVRRVLSITGLDRLLDIYPSVPASLDGSAFVD